MPPAPFGLLLALVLGVNMLGLFNEVFIADSALYAAIAKTMAETNNYLELFVQGKDWIDKPHFPFWVTALSFELFGISPFTYKLPAFLFTILALWYTFHLTRQWYGREAAWWSAIVLASAIHIILSNNDVRAEPFLMALLIGSVYHYGEALRRPYLLHLIAASFFAACAVMTKGIFTLIPIGAGVVVHLGLSGQWKMLLHWKWVLSAFLILVFILPELYALYMQFDLHPEKEVRGQTAFSGLRFFFWDSQFGRYANTGPIKGKGDWWFIPQTTLWAFGPWALLLYGGMVQVFRRKWTLPEWFSITVYLLMLLLFSTSQFQLSHYMNMVFPFGAVLTAYFLTRLRTETALRWYRAGQWIYWVIIGLVVLGVEAVLQSGRWPWLALTGFVAIALWWTVRRSVDHPIRRITSFSVLGSIVIGLYLNTVFYPVILEYQSGIRAAKRANRSYPGRSAGAEEVYTWLFEFYLDGPMVYTDWDESPSRWPDLLFTNQRGLLRLARQDIPFEVIETFGHYHTTALTFAFLYKPTRPGTLETRYLVALKKREYIQDNEH